MPQHDHIAVRVLVDEEPLREYPLPEGEDSEGGDHHCYIEAVVGQRFQVEVEWLPGFHLQHAPFLYAAIRVDDQEDNWFNWEGTEGMPHRKGRISQQYSCRFDHFPARNEYGDWKRVYRTFGALGIDDGDVNDSGIGPEVLKRLGNIEIKVYRAKAVQRLSPYIDDGELEDVIDTVPEKLMKGQEIKTNVKWQISHEAEPPKQPRHYDFVPMNGTAGKPTKFVFKYRTKKALQNLGCIPRSPSPPPNFELQNERNEETIRLLKEERRRQNLEIMRLREEQRVTNASRASSATLVEDDFLGPRGLKRQREDDDDEVQEMPPPPRLPVEVVDLTEDD